MKLLLLDLKMKTGRTFLKERCFHLVPVFLTVRFDNSNNSVALCTSNDLTVKNSILNLYTDKGNFPSANLLNFLTFDRESDMTYNKKVDFSASIYQYYYST